MKLAASRCLIAFWLLATAACQVQYVSNYDPETDQNVTALQKKVSTHLIGLRGQQPPDCLYANHEAFYTDALSDAQVILTRARAINADGLNALTVKQLELTSDSLNELRELHQAVSIENLCISDETLIDLNTLFNTNFKSILALEIAKRRTLSEAEPLKEQP